MPVDCFDFFRDRGFIIAYLTVDSAVRSERSRWTWSPVLPMSLSPAIAKPSKKLLDIYPRKIWMSVNYW